MRPRLAALALLTTLLLWACGSPPATFTPNPATLNFGTVYIGLKATKTTTWTSTYGSPLAVAMGVNAPFSCAPDPIPNVPANGTTGVVSFTFAPTAVGPFNDTANPGLTPPNAFTTVPVTPAGVTLSGTGAAQTSDTTLSLTGPAITGAVLDFGKVVVGASKALTFNVANASANAVTLTVTLLAKGPYSTAPAAITVAAKSSLAVTVTFAPIAVGVFPDAVEFTLGAPAAATARAGTAVTGEGVAPPPPGK